jgi:hypothetical protein
MLYAVIHKKKGYSPRKILHISPHLNEPTHIAGILTSNVGVIVKFALKEYCYCQTYEWYSIQFNSILFTFHVSYTGKHTIDLETVQSTNMY